MYGTGKKQVADFTADSFHMNVEMTVKLIT